MIKRLVCLANSRKLSGRCIAGRELLAGRPAEWVRPVSNREHEEVSAHERQYENRSEPRVLDIIAVPLIESRVVRPYQSENWLLDPGARWGKIGEFRRDNLNILAGVPGVIWLNGHSTSNGLNDYVPIEDVDESGGSLKLIAVSGGLRLHVYTSGEAFGNPRRKVQAEFSFSGVRYCLSVTDPIIETEYRGREDGVYTLGPSYLTISLGEPWNGNCYKLVAAIIGARA